MAGDELKCLCTSMLTIDRNNNTPCISKLYLCCSNKTVTITITISSPSSSSSFKCVYGSMKWNITRHATWQRQYFYFLSCYHHHHHHHHSVGFLILFACRSITSTADSMGMVMLMMTLLMVIAFMMFVIKFRVYMTGISIQRFCLQRINDKEL